MKLRSDSRVVVQEGVNARYLTAADFPVKFGLAVCDASFISLTLLIPAVAPLLAAHGKMVLLVKPQFEVERGQVGNVAAIARQLDQRHPAQGRQIGNAGERDAQLHEREA